MERMRINKIWHLKERSSRFRNWKGILRGRWNTLLAVFALVHPNMARVRMRVDKQAFDDYVQPIFRSYMRSVYPAVKVVPFSQAMRLLGIHVGPFSVSIPELKGYVGLYDWDRVALGTIARHYEEHPAFEIGTAAGSTALLLAQNSKQQVFTLDLPLDDEDNEFALLRLESDDSVLAGRKRAELIRDHPNEDITELLGDSATFDFYPYQNRIGLFFIDGAHSYEYVQSDTINACTCCTNDGIIIWDDFSGSRDVTRFLDDLARKGAEIYGIEGTKLAFSNDILALRRALEGVEGRA